MQRQPGFLATIVEARLSMAIATCSLTALPAAPAESSPHAPARPAPGAWAGALAGGRNGFSLRRGTRSPSRLGPLFTRPLQGRGQHKAGEQGCSSATNLRECCALPISWPAPPMHKPPCIGAMGHPALQPICPPASSLTALSRPPTCSRARRSCRAAAPAPRSGSRRSAPRPPASAQRSMHTM